jgi:hypothetical protein
VNFDNRSNMFALVVWVKARSAMIVKGYPVPSGG